MENQEIKDNKLLILTEKYEINNDCDGFVEDYFIMLPIETFQSFLKAEDPGDVCALYMFYCYTAKWQKTNQPKATNGYARKGLNLGRTRIERAQKYLIENGFIERIKRRDEASGLITGWYIKVKYRFQNSIYSKAIKEMELLNTTVDSMGLRNQFDGLKKKGLDEIIFERDKYICVYCLNKTESIDNLRARKMNNHQIVKYISENTNKIATIDHIIPISKGGDNSESNLITACLHCNCSKKDHLPEIKQVDKKPVGCLSTCGQTATNALSIINKNALESIKDVNPVFLELSNHLKELMLKNNPDAKITEKQIKDWSNDVRLMIERDKRTLAKIKVLIDWAQGNNFWKTNILSMGTLREKFDRLTLQMGQKSGGLVNRERGLEYKVRKAAANV